ERGARRGARRLASGSPKSCPPLASHRVPACRGRRVSCYSPGTEEGGMAMVLAEGGLPGRIERPEPGVLVQRLSTEDLAPCDQYPYWKEAVCGIFVGLDCSREARGAFHSAVLRRTFA